VLIDYNTEHNRASVFTELESPRIEEVKKSWGIFLVIGKK